MTTRKLAILVVIALSVSWLSLFFSNYGILIHSRQYKLSETENRFEKYRGGYIDQQNDLTLGLVCTYFTYAGPKKVTLSNEVEYNRQDEVVSVCPSLRSFAAS